MAYSRWRDGGFWYTSALTGAPVIEQSSLFINPKVGNSRTLTYARLKELNPDTNWVALNFPDCPDRFLADLLFVIDAFYSDMERNVYRYHGSKEPLPGVTHESRKERPVIDPRRGIIDPTGKV